MTFLKVVNMEYFIFDPVLGYNIYYKYYSTVADDKRYKRENRQMPS
jgi:hypothetical protein